MRGTGLLTGELTPAAKVTVRTALERIERELFDADWAAARAAHGDDARVQGMARTPVQRRHDALEEMARRATVAPADGKRPRPLLTVLVGEDAFRNVLELVDGTLVSPATAADLLDDAVIERMLFDSPSRVIDLGRQRSFVGAARRAVEVVHRRCAGEGCHVRADQCEIDHILPWSDLGPTHPDNGEPRCRPHHRQRGREPNGVPRPPPGVRSHDGDTPVDHLELARARARDRMLHDPTWGALADPHRGPDV